MLKESSDMKDKCENKFTGDVIDEGNEKMSLSLFKRLRIRYQASACKIRYEIRTKRQKLAVRNKRRNSYEYFSDMWNIIWQSEKAEYVNQSNSKVNHKRDKI